MTDTTTVEAPAATAPPIPALPAPPAFAAPSWASAIKKPEQIGPPRSIMLYGLPGTRKTSIAGGIVKVKDAFGNRRFKKVLCIDVDFGSEVFSNDPDTFAAMLDGSLSVVEIDPTAPDAKDRIDFIVKDVCNNAEQYGYDAVILDTLDVGQDIAEEVYEAKHATSGKGGTRDGFGVYGDLGVWTNKLVQMLHVNPHFLAIFTAHSKEDKGKILPRLSGSSKDSIGGTPSIVAYLQYMENPETKTTHLVATVSQSGITITKNRYNLPPSIVDFDLPTLYAQIEANKANVAAAAGIQGGN